MLFIDKLQGVIPASQEIVIIGIDDKSLQKIGAWPWNRDIFAKLLKALNKDQPRVAGMDILFLEERTGDDMFYDAIKQLNFPLILASKITNKEVLNSRFRGDMIKNGHINFYPEPDGKIRRAHLRKNNIDSLALTAFNEYRGKVALSTKMIDYSKPVLFNFTDEQFTRISFVDVLEDKVPKNFFKGKIVLVGSTSTDLKGNLSDNFLDISGKQIAGVNIHAHVINSLLQNKFQEELSIKTIFIVVLFMSILFLWLYDISAKSVITFVIFFVTFILLNFVGILLYEYGINWPFLTFSIVHTSLYMYDVIYKYIAEQRQRKFIGKAFGQYLNSKLLHQLERHPEKLKLGGEKKIMTVLFSDVRGFTTLSENMPVEKLIYLLNHYLETMSKIIFTHDGIIDKYIGDAIMAFWGAPFEDEAHELHAVQTALAMQETLDTFNQTFSTSQPLNIGIGINSGEMIVGNVGSEIKFNYTVLGDQVNLTSRLEGLTKKYGVSIIISKQTLSGIKMPLNDTIFRLLDEVIVKGKSTSIKIYEPMRNTEKNARTKEMYEAAFALYQKGSFGKARILFEKLPHDKPALLLYRRINEMSDVQNWRGVWKWEEK